MKILAVGRNYAAHAEELGNDQPDQPVVFTKPSTAVLRGGAPFVYPDFSKEVHYEVELVLQIGRVARRVTTAEASQYYNAIGVGVDFTARDLQNWVKQKQLPWDIAKGFDGSAPVSEFLPVGQMGNLRHIRFRLEVNGQTRQEGDTRLMLFDFDYIVSYLSKFFTLEIGDLIFTGTPQGVGPVAKGDRLTAYVGDKKMLEFDVV